MSNTTDRAALARACALVRPALASRGYVPSQTHIKFDGKWATAYNDVMAISVPCDLDLKRLVPGDLLIQGVASFGGKEVLFSSEATALVVKSGRAKVTLPTLDPEAWTHSWPADEGAPVDLDADIVRGVDQCLVSVGNDSTQPAQMGVTLDADEGGRAVLFSTDNKSVSRRQCKAKAKLPGDVPVIMPKAFCEQLVSLSKAHPGCEAQMLLRSGSIEVRWWDEKDREQCRLFTRVPVDVSPMDFGRVLRKHCGDLSALKKRLALVPEGLDSAVGRALLVLQGEVRKKASVEVDGGTLRIKASSDLGNADDSMKAELEDVARVSMDAELVARGLKLASRIGITESVTILTGGEDCEFVHMVAHIAEV